MNTRSKKHNADLEDFERKARELTTLLFALSERRINALPMASPLGKALAAAALNVQNGLDVFVKITQLTE